MPRAPIWLAIVAVAAAFALGAAAASLGVGTVGLGSGAATVERCTDPDTTDLEVDYGTDDPITEVTVSGFDAACDGGAIFLVLVDDDHQAQTPEVGGTVVIDDQQVTVTFDTGDAPPRDEISGVRLVVVGGAAGGGP